jgi:uncharacterized protein involved in exopolysaccharide biosynthesis
MRDDQTNSHENSTLRPVDLIQALRDQPRLWLAPAAIAVVLASCYLLVRSPRWEATQALYVREGATVDHRRPGSFSDLAEMKTMQETILELARTDGVLRAALVQVGPPEGYSQPADWPTKKDIAAVRNKLKITPPGGAEFGKTEVFYLQAEDRERQRAVALVAAICGQLEHRFRDLRQEKAESMINELRRTESLAEAELRSATQELATLEASVGIDLGELRMLLSSASANSDLRQKVVEIEDEVRGYEAKQRQGEQLLAMLISARNDPGRLLASPNALLESQPGLRRLKEGLIDAQLRTSQLLGTRSGEHPLVASAKASEQEIGENLHTELEIAIRGLQVELAMSAERLQSLGARRGELQGRLQELAGLRARYAALVATAENRTALLEEARADVAEAHANRAASASVSLLSRIDQADTGIYPIGPSKKVIVLAAALAGLLVGLGLVFLTTAPGYADQARLLGDDQAAQKAAPDAQRGLSLKRPVHKKLRAWAASL